MDIDSALTMDEAPAEIDGRGRHLYHGRFFDFALVHQPPEEDAKISVPSRCRRWLEATQEIDDEGLDVLARDVCDVLGHALVREEVTEEGDGLSVALHGARALVARQ